MAGRSLSIVFVVGIGALAEAQSTRPPAAANGEWTLPGRDYGLTRFSPLNQITTENVVKLK